MSDNNDDDLEKIEKEVDEELKKRMGEKTEEGPSSGGGTSDGGDSADEGSSGDEGDSSSGNEDEDEKTYEKGVARAYQKDGKPKKRGRQFDGKFAPADRGKKEYVKKEGKLIGEVLYDEFIKFMEWLMYSSVDLVLDFADYILLKSYEGVTSLLTSLPEDKEDKKTVFDYGREIEKEHAERAAKGIGFYKSALTEVLDNIEKHKQGLPLDWQVLGRQPEWFDEAVKLEREASADPSSEAAKKWLRFKNSDKIIEGRLGNESIHQIIATRIATFEEAMKGEEYKLPGEIKDKLAEMEDLLKQEKIDPADLKQKMAEKINKMREMTNDTGFVSRSINEQLNKMQIIAESEEADVEKLKKGFNASIKDIKDINPIPEHIKTLSREDYDELTRNIDKINEKYKDDPEMRIEVRCQYVNGVIAALNKAQEDIIKYEKSNRFSKSKAAEKTKKTIYGLINKAGDYVDKDGKVISSLKTQREKAEQGIASVKSAITDFKVENKKISEYADATRRSSAPEMDKGSMLRQMSSYFRSR